MFINSNSVNIFLFSGFLIGTCLFLYGFYPIVYSHDAPVNFDDVPKQIDDFNITDNLYKTTTSKFVLMVIDALRTDFIEVRNDMNYTKHLLQHTDLANYYNIKVHPPTVTLPRIKSLTSGTIPSFVDVVLNFGSSRMKIDNFVEQLQRAGKKVVFYGDNTWSKLFPEAFLRSGETRDSFFVNDFYEGDMNVTKNVNFEIRNSDWDVMILHYLGLDHIGHVEGPDSNKIPAKLKELDDVIADMHRTLSKRFRNPVIFVTGDHGMRDTGGHGGSSHAELNVPLVVIGMNCTREDNMDYKQTDLATTISVLLGIPIPSSSIGSVMKDLVNNHPAEKRFLYYYYSTTRLMDKVKKSIPNWMDGRSILDKYRQTVENHKEYLRLTRGGNMCNTSTKCYKALQFTDQNYVELSNELTAILIRNYLKFDILIICVGILMNFCTFFTFLYSIAINGDNKPLRVDFSFKSFVIYMLSAVLTKTFIVKLTEFDSILSGLTFVSITLMSLIAAVLYGNVIIIRMLNAELRKKDRRYLSTIIPRIASLDFFILFVIGFHAFSFASSSFIEEEHQTWYYIVSTIFLVFLWSEVKEMLRKEGTLSTLVDYHDIHVDQFIGRNISFFGRWFAYFGLHVFLRRLNQTGDKWLSIPDVGDWLATEENKSWLSLFAFVGLTFMVITCTNYNGMLTNVLVFTAAILIYYIRTIMGSILFVGVKPSTSKTGLAIFWLNVLEIFCIAYIPIAYKLIVRKTLTRHEIKTWLGSNVTIFCVVSALLHKPHNIILNGACMLTCNVANNLCNFLMADHPKRLNIVKVIVHLWIGKCFFFYQGNSNSIASIDLNAGYIGLDNFNFIFVAIFLTLNTYSGVILSYLCLLYNLYDVKPPTTDKIRSINVSSAISRGMFGSLIPVVIGTVITPVVFYLVVMTGHRHHIFIWTVFSPKILYDFYHMFLMFGFVVMTNFIEMI